MPELLLRPWRVTDAPTMRRLVTSTPDLDRQLPVLDDLSAVRTWIANSWTSSTRFFAVTDNGVAIGNVGAAHLETSHGTGWFSYWMAGTSRGRGVASAAAATAATWLLTECPGAPFRLELGARVNNPASITVAERAGFVREGLERQKLRYDGERFDVLTMARLRSDPVPNIAVLPLVTDRE